MAFDPSLEVIVVSHAHGGTNGFLISSAQVVKKAWTDAPDIALMALKPVVPPNAELSPPNGEYETNVIFTYHGPGYNRPGYRGICLGQGLDVLEDSLPEGDLYFDITVRRKVTT